MSWLQTTFTIRYNRKKKRVGHLFQGRYKAQLVEDDHYGQELIEYIHLNPIRKRKNGRVIQFGDWEQLINYPWSSHFQYSRSEEDSRVPVNVKYLKFWGKDETTGRAAYRKSLRKLVTNDVPVDPFTEIQESLAMGSKDFLKKAKEMVAAKSGKTEKKKKKRWQAVDREAEIRKRLNKERING